MGPGSAPIEALLVAVDFSPPAERALDYAARLAERHGARLCVVHAVEWLESWWSPMKLSSDFRDKLQHEGRERLEDSLSRCAAQPDSVDFEIGFGPAWQVLLEAAGKRPYDLLVLGTRGLHGAAKLLLGSTAQRVIERAQVPVLTCPQGEEPIDDSTHRILVPTDLSLDFETPLETAIRLHDPSIDRRVEVILLHGIDLPHRYEVHVKSWTDFVDGAVETIREHVEEYAEDLRERGLGATVIVKTGDPAEVILEIARRESVDLIALNRRGGVPKPRLHFGGTAKRVVQHAPCPVLTVAPE